MTVTDPGIRFGLAGAAVVVALFAAAALRFSPGQSEALVGLVVAVAGVASAPYLGAAVGVVGWAFCTGFVENRYGVLTFARGDLGRLTVLVCVGVLTALATRRSGSRPGRPSEAADWSQHREGGAA